MADVDGAWNCTAETPMGEQQFTLTVKSEGDRFHGKTAGKMGSVAIADGTVEGNALSWTMHVTKPMPLTLTCRATVDGDRIAGKVKAGFLGSCAVPHDGSARRLRLRCAIPPGTAGRFLTAPPA